MARRVEEGKGSPPRTVHAAHSIAVAYAMPITRCVEMMVLWSVTWIVVVWSVCYDVCVTRVVCTLRWLKYRPLTEQFTGLVVLERKIVHAHSRSTISATNFQFFGAVFSTVPRGFSWSRQARRSFAWTSRSPRAHGRSNELCKHIASSPKRSTNLGKSSLPSSSTPQGKREGGTLTARRL